MKKIVAILVAVGLVSLVAGCAMPMNAPVYGGLFTQAKGPQSMGDSTVQPSKTGTAQAQAIVFIGMGDSSISAAMKAGGITKIHHVDTEIFSVLGVYAVSKTIVYGE